MEWGERERERAREREGERYLGNSIVYQRGNQVQSSCVPAMAALYTPLHLRAHVCSHASIGKA